MATIVPHPDSIRHGIAMHGAPKYDAQATHLDYVNPEAPKGGTLKQAVIGSFDTLNPHNIKGKPAAGLEYLYDRLAARVWDEPFTLYGLIAEQIIIPEDRSAITFILNPAARFHDGTPILASDVAFSFETLKSYGRPNMRRVYGLVSRVEIQGERQIAFTLGEGYDQETVMILAMMPVLSERDWAGKDFDATPLAPPIGSGPYKIASLEQGRQITYERVTDYWAKDHFVNKGQYNFDRLVYDYYRDKTVMIQAFQSGAFDLYREFAPSSWINNFGKNSAKPYIAAEIPHSRPESVRAMIFNTQRPPFDDIKVRKALSLAFDFDWMNKTLLHGKAKRITSTFPNTELAAPLLTTDESQVNDSLPLRERLKQSDSLLREAGWIVKENKRVREATGEALRFTVTLNDAEYEKIVLNYAEILKKLGIDITIRTVDSAQFVGLLGMYDYDMIMYRWVNSLSPGTEQQIYWGCDAAKTEGSRNYARICTPAIDALSTAIATAKTREELVEHVHALDRAIMAEHVMIPLYYIGMDYVAYWPKLARPSNVPLYGMVVETWWQDAQGATP